MLYDPKWEKQTETKAGPLSLAGLIAWLEAHPPETTYEWAKCDGTCLIDQYLASIGNWPNRYRGPVEGDPYFLVQGGDPCNIAVGTPHTFGAALERARKIAARRLIDNDPQPLVGNER